MQVQTIQQHARQFKAYKDLNKAQIEQEVSKQYLEAQEERKTRIMEQESKMKQLEQVEQYLVEQLGKTQKT